MSLGLFNERDQGKFAEFRIQIEIAYALICKNCHSKVLDPEKNNIQQVFTNGICPKCGKSKKEANKNKGGKK